MYIIPTDIPVALFIYKRPDLVVQTLAGIRKGKPSRVYLIADGPKTNDDANVCEETRQISEQAIDWDCDLKTLYADENLGLVERITSGLNWVFQHEDRVVVLEDDCLPSETFLPFCKEMLDLYKADPRVFAISGDNFQQGYWRGEASYYFSNYFHCWGWATWKDSWQEFDMSLSDWDDLKQTKWLKNVFNSRMEALFWKCRIDDVLANHANIWSLAFAYAMWKRGSYCISPNRNLVKNIGFDERGTNASRPPAGTERAGLEKLEYPLKHPKKIQRNQTADHFTFKHHFFMNKKIKRHMFTHSPHYRFHCRLRHYQKYLSRMLHGFSAKFSSSENK